MKTNWAILQFTTIGTFDNHYPKHPWIQFCKKTPIVYPLITKTTPLKDCLTLFTDGSKNGVGMVVTAGKSYTTLVPSAQLAELAAVILAFSTFPDDPFNLLSDSNYVISSLSVLETVPYIAPASTAASSNPYKS